MSNKHFALFCTMHLPLLITWTAILTSQTCLSQQSSIATDDDAVTAFKRYLATPPCYSRVLFSEADCDNNVTRSYYAAVCGDNYVYRTLDGNPNIDFPISITNRNRSSIFVGRWGGMRWAIAGYNLTVQTGQSGSLRVPDGSVYVNEILTLGFQHVQAGTFVWRGNHFDVKPSLLARELGVTENLTGEIIIEQGRVKRMIIKTAGVSEFQYDDSVTNIPMGLPSIISRLMPDGHCYKRFFLHNLTAASRQEELATIFDPKQRIQPEIAVIHSLSNDVETVTDAQNPELRKGILAEQLVDFAHLTSQERARRSFLRRTFQVVLFLLVGFGVWRLWTRRSTA